MQTGASGEGAKRKRRKRQNGAATFAFAARFGVLVARLFFFARNVGGWESNPAENFPIVAIHLAWRHGAPDLEWISKNLQRKKTG